MAQWVKGLEPFRKNEYGSIHKSWLLSLTPASSITRVTVVPDCSPIPSILLCTLYSFEPFGNTGDPGDELLSKGPSLLNSALLCWEVHPYHNCWVLSRLRSSDSDYQSIRCSSNCQTWMFTSFHPAASLSSAKHRFWKTPIQIQDFLYLSLSVILPVFSNIHCVQKSTCYKRPLASRSLWSDPERRLNPLEWKKASTVLPHALGCKQQVQEGTAAPGTHLKADFGFQLGEPSKGVRIENPAVRWAAARHRKEWGGTVLWLHKQTQEARA